MAKSLLFDQLYPNRFLHAEEFRGKDVTLTIASVDLEELEGAKGKQMKVVIRFAETPKQWVAPKSCGIPLKRLWGKDAGKWVGHKVTLYPASVDAFNERVEAIRVRGSPELTAPIEWVEQLGRKESKFKLLPTGKGAASDTPPARQAEDGTALDENGNPL